MTPSEKKRLSCLYVITIALFAVVLARLYAISSGSLADVETLWGQYFRRMDIAERRGYVLSSELKALGISGSKNITAVIPSEKTDARELAELLSAYCDKSSSELYGLISSHKPFFLSASKPVSFGKSVVSFTLPEKGGSEAIHLLGYVGGDGKGACGLEKSFDGFLSGKSSGRLFLRYEADAAGRLLSGGYAEAVNDGFGETGGVVTTLRKPLQETAETVADALIESGAIVVIDAENGDILASASRPAYTRDTVAELLTSEKGEFVNRALSGFAPGSVFKTAVAAAALRLDIGYYDKIYECRGYVSFGNAVHRCHKLSGHGELTMKEAFAKSCNCFFIQLGLEIGPDNVFDTAEEVFGIGKRTLLYGAGSYGSPFPRASVYPPSMVANCVIGQGDVLLSPLEAAKMMAVASTGLKAEPRLVKGFLADGEFLPTEERVPEKVLPDEVTEKLREMFAFCVSDGTGKKAAPERGAAGGKTATAQTGIISETGNELNHIWFAGVYPVDKPEIAVAVLLDSREAESDIAKWAFRAMCEEWHHVGE